MSATMNPLIGVRTHFSLGESVMTPADIVAQAKALSLTQFAVCDTMSVSSLVEITRLATKEGIHAIVGARLRIVEALVREKGSNAGAAYIKVFPRNERGMNQIFELLSTAFDEDHFYEVPRLTWSDIETLGNEHLVWTTGDVDGIFGNAAARPSLIKMIKMGLAPYVELVPINTPFFDRFNAEAIRAANVTKLEPLLSYPAFYSDGEFDTFVTSLAIQKRSTISAGYTVWQPAYTDAKPQSLSSLIALANASKTRLQDRYELEQGDIWKRAIVSTARFSSDCAYVWEKQPISLPDMDPDPDKRVAQLCSEGMKARLFNEVNGFKPTSDDIRDVYIPRLKYELQVLRDLKFATYFLTVSDVVNWAKSQNILVGPGRGSVGGSLVAYVMGITDVDPIRFGLLFERFINPSRNDLPDADLDFMSTRRQEVIDYLAVRHGKEKVAGLSNYGKLEGASALRDVARVYGYNMADLEITKMVPKVHGQAVDLETARKEVSVIQAWADSNPEVWRLAVDLQKTMRSYGKHAAGTVVSGVPLTERCVVETRSGERVINWDMRASEDTGLVKLDILGLSTLDTLSRCLGYIKERHSKTIDLTAIPLDDEATLKMFAEGRTMGVFQFEGGAARRILKDMAKVNPLHFDDLVAANALNRPGPIEAGLVKQYVEAKNGYAHVPLPHPNMSGALAETFNVICYQEQVMRVSVDLCGFSLSEADKLRKIMGKKQADEMKKMREGFVNGAVSHSGMVREEAEDLFSQIESFAGYAFNKSHAVEYSLISYQVAWLKTHYPVEFFAAALSTVDEVKLAPLVEEATRRGIEVLPPDINISTDEFVIATDTKLYVPFNRVKGLSEKVSEAIMEGRALTSYEVEVKTKEGRRVIRTMETVPCKAGQFASLEEFHARVAARRCNSAHVDKLTKIGAFARIIPGDIPQLHEDRRRDQHELIPGLMINPVVINREISSDKYAVIGINNLYADIDTTHAKTVNVRPLMGKHAKFMAVLDAPSRGEEQNKKMASSDGFLPISEALFEAGLDRNWGYWTALVKKAKNGGSAVSGTDIASYAGFLEREIEILRPPLIIALGSNAARYFMPEIKGSAMDYVGKMFYDRKRDANILIGFTPGMVFHDPDKQMVLNDIFDRVNSLIS